MDIYVFYDYVFTNMCSRNIQNFRILNFMVTLTLLYFLRGIICVIQLLFLFISKFGFIYFQFEWPLN